MTLAFSTQLNNKPTYFVEKVIFGLEQNKFIDFNELGYFFGEYYGKFKEYFEGTITNTVAPKIHTIRRDEFNRWKAGYDIHFVINNRTPQRYQFAPVVKCTSTQEINIVYWYNPKTQAFDSPKTYVDGKELDNTVLLKLATNDGFDSISDFYAYFKGSFNGKIIHWTNTKY